MKARQRVGDHRRVGVPEVGLGVDIVDRRGDVETTHEGSSGSALTAPFSSTRSARAASASRAIGAADDDGLSQQILAGDDAVALHRDDGRCRSRAGRGRARGRYRTRSAGNTSGGRTCRQGATGAATRPCALAIFSDTPPGVAQPARAAQLAPAGPTAPMSCASSRAPICFISTRVCSWCASSRTSSRKSTRPSAAR